MRQDGRIGSPCLYSLQGNSQFTDIHGLVESFGIEVGICDNFVVLWHSRGLLRGET